ncbi:MAG TPA: ferredoxin [Anaerolineaceae bacterium]|jgi:ferredoxin|nr:ferredoxin [Anaerolineaceae bacterium]HOG77078.1 ferredoxin [Anaerolineaceae bacterium]
MKVSVDKDLCIGCGVCEGIAPTLFSLENAPTAEVLLSPVPEAIQEAARQAAEDCPEGAILVEEDESRELEPENPERDIIVEEFADENREDIDQKLKEKKMKAIVDKDLCIACGVCEGIAPEVFSLQREPYAEVLLDPIPAELEDAVEEAKEECPEGAITIEA